MSWLKPFCRFPVATREQLCSKPPLCHTFFALELAYLSWNLRSRGQRSHFLLSFVHQAFCSCSWEADQYILWEGFLDLFLLVVFFVLRFSFVDLENSRLVFFCTQTENISFLIILPCLSWSADCSDVLSQSIMCAHGVCASMYVCVVCVCVCFIMTHAVLWLADLSFW